MYLDVKIWNKEHNSIYDYTNNDTIDKNFEITHSCLFTKRKDQLKIYKINPYPIDYNDQNMFDYVIKYMNKEVIKEIGFNEEEILTEIHRIDNKEINERYSVISQNKSLYYQYMKTQSFRDQGYYTSFSNWLCIGKSELSGNSSTKMKNSNISENEDFFNSSNVFKSYYELYAGDIIKLGKIMFKIIEINSSLRPDELNSYNKNLTNQKYVKAENDKAKEIIDLGIMIQETINPRFKIMKNEKIIGNKNLVRKKTFEYRNVNKSIRIDKKSYSLRLKDKIMINNSFNSFANNEIHSDGYESNELEEEKKSSLESSKAPSLDNENESSDSQNQTYDFIIENSTPNKAHKLSVNSKSKLKKLNENEEKSNTNFLNNDSIDIINEKNNIVLKNDELISKIQTSNNIPKVITKKRKKKKKKENEDTFEVPSCRICFGLTEFLNPLICCCNCLGSVRYTHLDCLKNWIKSKFVVSAYRKLIVVSKTIQNCEICKFPYPLKIKVGQSIEYLYNFERPERNGNQHYIIMEGFNFSNAKASNLYILSFDNPNDTISFGRSNNTDIRLSCTSVSRQHSKMSMDNNGSIYLEDENSKFGTLVLLTDEIKIIPANKLLIQFNNTLFKFNLNRLTTFCSTLFCCFSKSNKNLYNQTYSDYILKQKKLQKEEILESQFFNVADYKEFDRLKEQLMNLKDLKTIKEKNIREKKEKSPKKKVNTFNDDIDRINYLNEYEIIANVDENINYIS